MKKKQSYGVQQQAQFVPTTTAAENMTRGRLFKLHQHLEEKPTNCTDRFFSRPNVIITFDKHRVLLKNVYDLNAQS